MKSMSDLFLHCLQDIYYAEKAGLKSMAKTGKAVESGELRDAILKHREQSQGQIERLEQVFERLGKKVRGKTCEAMDGLVAEGQDAVDDGEKGPVLDAALVACGQAIEHYEIARYGALVAWARTMGMTEAAELLQRTLDEERQNDALLSEIAERSLNRRAAESGGSDAADKPRKTKPHPKR